MTQNLRNAIHWRFPRQGALEIGRQGVGPLRIQQQAQGFPARGGGAAILMLTQNLRNSIHWRFPRQGALEIGGRALGESGSRSRRKVFPLGAAQRF